MASGKSIYLSVILPTYNEYENIRKLIPEIVKFLGSQKFGWEILVVDDNSPDGTAQIVRQMAKKISNLRLILRKKKAGIGAALRHGYNEAHGQYFLSMDADLSLKVADISKLVAEVKNGYDLVLGSKYLKGSVYKKVNLPIKIRSMISMTGNRYIGLILGIPVRDFSLNFRIMKRQLWKAIKPLDDQNYFLAETIIQAYRKGFSIKEVPITFIERSYGKSKTRVWNQSFVFFFETLKYFFK